MGGNRERHTLTQFVVVAVGCPVRRAPAHPRSCRHHTPSLMMAVGDPLHSSPARAHSSRLYHEMWWWPRAGIYHTEITTATLRLDDYVSTRTPGLHTLQGLVVNRLVFHSGPFSLFRIELSCLRGSCRETTHTIQPTLHSYSHRSAYR